ncbi:methanogen homoaconitase small subunit [Methanobrevibacter gottschalkii]|uniref:Methanogen homoaconitase small subunit n=2 Tax=Methanobrevibacter gottschalkii TaxID=190974 RepID=A0A3N5BP50_9EURY|nr:MULTISPECIES: homoaconitase small subunit [Methanobrevibacter]MCQ2970996.1 homoaconitase small subunit [archaeon]OEC96819.1 3-isopropylmalate dehydratase [Methanobrevibacter sp. A27]RPF51538.1 methanogen homoaconitase small subunit [Methanobrevibacter gottschalkii DSM 11977]SEK71090.1 methanogen homoaconitase small subunit [Methanobrevibacter gottschalkii]
MDIIKGKTWTFGENIDTDVIIPGRYLRTFNPQDLADHVLEGERPDFTQNVQKGDIIVADENFGCGSSREQAPVAIKTAGVSAIVAKSFARIFYRNAINIGLPVIVSDIEAEDGDVISIDLSEGKLVNETTGDSKNFEPFKEFMLNILEDGGLVNHYLNESD